jgi:TolA-binding protein
MSGITQTEQFNFEEEEGTVESVDFDDVEAEVPTHAEHLKLDTQISEGIRRVEAEEEETTARPPKTDKLTPDSDDSDDEDGIGKKTLSVMSEVNEHTSKISNITDRLSDLEAKIKPVDQIAELDRQLKLAAQTNKELTEKIDSLAANLRKYEETSAKVRESQSAHHTSVTRQFLELERKWANKQLEVDPKPIETSIAPDPEVILSREGVSLSPPAEKKKFVVIPNF